MVWTRDNYVKVRLPRFRRRREDDRPTYHLLGDHNDRLETEPAIAVVEEIF